MGAAQMRVRAGPLAAPISMIQDAQGIHVSRGRPVPGYPGWLYADAAVGSGHEARATSMPQYGWSRLGGPLTPASRGLARVPLRSVFSTLGHSRESIYANIAATCGN